LVDAIGKNKSKGILNDSMLCCESFRNACGINLSACFSGELTTTPEPPVQAVSALVDTISRQGDIPHTVNQGGFGSKG
jgi:hypothetical protein